MAASGLGADNINATDPKTGLPLYTQRVRDDFASPQLQQAMRSGGSARVKIGDTDYTITNGRITAMNTGSLIKPLLAAAAVAGTAGLAGGFVPGVAGLTGAGGSASAFVGPTLPAATTTGSTFLGMSAADLARYGLSTAGSVVNGILQSRAQGKQFDASQKYLEEALAYQKEQDAFNRTRQTGLDAQDVARYAYSTGVNAAQYGDSQQTQLADFARNENRYAYTTDLETSRYGDYSKRIAPYLASGASANDRAASLLGLPAGAAFDPTLTAAPKRVVSAPPSLSNPGTGFGGGGSGPAIDRTGQNFDPAYIGQQLDALYAAHGTKATGPGTGPTDKAYMTQAILSNKGWEPYWTDRIAQELKQAGVGH